MAATMTIEATGAYLCREAAEKGYATAQVSSLFVRVTRHGNEWALELCDETPIDAVTVGAWDKAVGVTHGGVWRCEAHGKVWRCEWQGTEEPAADGPRATWIGGR